MVSEPSSSSNPRSTMREPNLTIQSFHQCASLVSTKLGSNNYLMWRSQILHLSRSLGVLHHLQKDDTKPRPLLDDNQTENPAYFLWLTNDGLLISWLLSTIKEEAQPSIAEDATAYDVWSSLEEQLLPTTIEKEGLLKNVLMTIKKGSKSLDEYIKEFNSICDNLAAIKKPVADLDKVFQFARGLGAKYEGFRLAMVTKPPYPTFNQFLIALQGYEQTLASQKEEEKSYIEHNQAFFGQRGRGRNGAGRRGGFSSRGRGFTPAGRYNNAGPSSNNPTKEGTKEVFQHQGKGDKPICQICGKMNHVALDCWYRFDYSYQSADPPQALAALTLNNNDPSLYMDSGATSHMTNDAGILSHLKPYRGNDVIYVGDGNKLAITHTGATCVGELDLKDVLVVPQLQKNLVSVGKLTTDNVCTVEFTPSDFVIKDRNRRSIGKGRKQGQLYALDSSFHEALSAIRNGDSFSLWHQRLGHPSAKILSLLKGKKVIDVVNWQTKPSICVSCQSGKSCKQPFHLNNKISDFPLQKVHCDLWGPAPNVSNQGFRFYVIFVDDFSRFSWLYPLKQKSDFYSCFLKFQRLVENQFDRKIKIFQCDGGGEFNSLAFLNHCDQCGIQLQISCPGTPEQNGVAERKHRHIVETGLTMLFNANMPLFLWIEAFLAATYLINRMPAPVLNNQSPYFKLYQKEPDYKSLRVFGCLCFPSLRYRGGNKFVKKTYPCVFLGYSPIHKGYRCYEPQRKRVYISRHVVFDEGQFPYKSSLQESTHMSLNLAEFPSLDEWFSTKGNLTPPTVQQEQESTEEFSIVNIDACCNDDSCNTDNGGSIETLGSPIPLVNNEELSIESPSEVEVLVDRNSQAATFVNDMTAATNDTPARPQRHRQPPSYLQDYECYLTQEPSHTEPWNYRTALKDSRWVAAMKEELEALHSNKTWSLVPRPSDVNVVGSKWVYRIKQREDGSIDRFKARLVARGFTQVSGIDFDETYSPVIRHTTIRLVIALSTSLNWCMRQLDVKNAFLHGHLKETVYMEQPPGFEDPTNPDFVCLLHKSLYGLKQAPRAWFDRLSQFLLHLGFFCSKADSSLFVYNKNSVKVLLLIYVDDILVTGNNETAISHLISQLSSEFAIKDLGSLSFFLGVEVKYFPGGVLMSQGKYIKDLLARTGMTECAHSATPMALKDATQELDETSIDVTYYRSVVGALQYLTFTRPDIQHAVNKVCQFSNKPTAIHLKAVKRILRYLKGTKDYGLRFISQSPLSLYAFSDADWAGCPLTRRSTTGFCVFLGGNCISWCSKKQPTVARSSSEAEYRSMASTTAELTWLTFLLRDIGIPLFQPPQLFCDNLSALHMSVNPLFHARTKHIEIDYHFVREKVAMGTLITRFVPSSSQLADIFTKPLSKSSFFYLRSKLGLDLHTVSSLRGDDKDPVIESDKDSIIQD